MRCLWLVTSSGPTCCGAPVRLWPGAVALPRGQRVRSLGRTRRSSDVSGTAARDPERLSHRFFNVHRGREEKMAARRQGRTINEEILLRHVAPLGWEHIGLTGDYVWSTADQSPSGTLRPPRQRQSLLA